MVLQENDHPITGTINRFGWRDVNWPIRKPKGTIRIAILGDSFVEAIQVEDDSTFESLSKRALIGAEGRGEVMNFGRSGYTQSEELLVLQRDVLRFDPDVVVLFFFPGNDITDMARRTAPNRQRPFFVMGNGASSRSIRAL